MLRAKRGDLVKVHYTGMHSNGTVFHSSHQHDPLEFRLGDHATLPGFENILLGMLPGQVKTRRVSSSSAYGPRRPELVLQIERRFIKLESEPWVGMELAVDHGNGHVTPVQVTDVTPSQVTLDANHPLAGKDLVFQVQLVEVQRPTQMETVPVSVERHAHFGATKKNRWGAVHV